MEWIEVSNGIPASADVSYIRILFSVPEPGLVCLSPSQALHLLPDLLPRPPLASARTSPSLTMQLKISTPSLDSFVPLQDLLSFNINDLIFKNLFAIFSPTRL